MKSINLPVTLDWITQSHDSLIEHTEKVLAGVAGSQLPKKKSWLSLLENHLSILFTVWSIVQKDTKIYEGLDNLDLLAFEKNRGEIPPSSFWNQQLIPFAWPPFSFRKSHQHHTSCQMIQFVFNKTKWLPSVSRPTRTMSSDDFWRVQVARLCVWSAA